MKDLMKKMPKNVYLSEYDINVTPYLTDMQILIICTQLLDCENYIERQIYLCTAIMEFCTDMTEEDFEKVDYNILLNSGLLNAVYSKINNIDMINQYMKHEESITRTISKCLDGLIDMFGFMDKEIATNESKVDIAKIKENFAKFVEEHKDDNVNGTV